MAKFVSKRVRYYGMPDFSIPIVNVLLMFSHFWVLPTKHRGYALIDILFIRNINQP